MRILPHALAIAALIPVFGLGLAPAAQAACDIKGDIFYLHANDSTKHALKTDMHGCDLHFISSGKIDFRTATIMNKPKNGMLEKVAHLEFVYRPNKDFKGSDDFVVKVCGSTQKGKGCSTLNYTATVD